MKKFKNLLIFTLCLTFMVTTLDVSASSTDYEISPLDHYTKDSGHK